MTSSPEPLDYQVLSGPTLSDFLDPTLEKFLPVISLEEEEELPDGNSLEDLAGWLGIDCPSV
jgi:hypothetical protein